MKKLAAISLQAVLLVAVCAVRTAYAQFLYVTSPSTSSVTGINAANNSVVTTIPGVSGASAIAISPNGFAYVTETAVCNGANVAGSIAVVDIVGNRIANTVPLGAGNCPEAVAISPDGTTVYVALVPLGVLGGSVAVISAATNSVVTTIPLPGPGYALAVSPDGKTLYVESIQQILKIDTTTKNVTTGASGICGRAGGAGPMIISPDGSRLYATNCANEVFVIDASTLTFKVFQTVPCTVGGIAITPDDKTLLASDIECGGTQFFDIATQTVTGSLAGGAQLGFLNLVVTPDGHRAFGTTNGGVSAFSGVSAFDPTNDQVAPTTVASVAGAFGIAIVPALPARSPVSPTSLTFGPQALTTASPAQFVTVTNNGTTSFSVSSILVSPVQEFPETDNCIGVSLQPGDSCTAQFQFAPAAAGTRPGTATFEFSDPTIAAQQVSLSGTGVTAAVSFVPPALTFGSTNINSLSSAQPLVISNFGATTLTIANPNGGNDPSGDFQENDNCAFDANGNISIAPGQVCVLDILFSPTQMGVETGQLIATDGAGNTYIVPLSGTAIPRGVRLLASAMSFGSQAVGTISVAQIETVTNQSDSDLQVSKISITGDYQVLAENCTGAALPFETSCEIVLDFGPTASGARSGQMLITDNQKASSPQIVTLSGFGTSGGLTLSPSSLSFGTASPSLVTPTQMVSITNNSNSDVIISSITTLDDGTAHYAETDNCQPFPFTLAMGATCTAQVNYAPLGFGRALTGQVIIVDSDPPDSPHIVSLTGPGTAGIHETVNGTPVDTFAVSPSFLSSSGTVAVSDVFQTLIAKIGGINATETDNCQPTSTSCNIDVSFGSGVGQITIDDPNHSDQSPLIVALASPATEAIKARTKTALSPSANPSVFGQSVTFTATVTAVAPATGTPTGSVTFLDGSAPLATITIDPTGAAVFQTNSLAVGMHAISASYGGDANFLASTSSLNQTVAQAAPAITWATPAPITYGTLLSATQLDASASVAGTFVYLPAAGTLLPAGNHSLSVTFTPSDAVDYTTATATVVLVVNQATPAITWATPAPILFGTPLSNTQLDASSPVAGNFAYSPPAGTVLNPGSQTLSTTFTPTSTNYTTATASVLLAVDEAPAITSAASAAFTEGVAGSFTVMSIGFPIPVLSESPTLPTGISFTDNGNGTATLSGTPAAGTAGTYTLTLQAVNGIGVNANQTFTLTIGTSLSIVSGSGTTFTVGSTGSFSVITSGTPVPSVTKTGNLPSGVTFVDNGDGTAMLSGTPATGSQGSYPFQISATNSVGAAASQKFILTVNATGPAILTGNVTTFAVATQGTFTVETTGSPTATLTVAGSLPQGVNFVDNGDGTATLSGIPNSGAAGTYAVTITATSGAAAAPAAPSAVNPNSASQSFTFIVNPAVGLTSTNVAAFTEGTAGTFTVTVSGKPAPALVEIGNLPTGVTFVDNANGFATLSGTPAAGSSGEYDFIVRAKNVSGSDAIQSFTLSVAAPLGITSANATTFTVGSAGSFTVTTSGTPTPSLTESGNLPSVIGFKDDGNGTASLSGTPAIGTGGVYSLSLVAHNGISKDATQAFTLTIDEAASISLSASNLMLGVGAPISFSVRGAGFPKPSLSENGALPHGITFHDNGDGTGSLSGAAAQGTEGTYHLSFTASNALGSQSANFTLTVYGNVAPAFTSANSATFAAGVQNSFLVTTTGAPPIVLTVSPTRLPVGLTFHDNKDGTATLSGKPFPSNRPIVLTFTATGAGGKNFAAVQKFTLTIKPSKPPVFTSANHAAFTEGVLGSFTVTVTGLPIPKLTAAHPPAGITFQDNHDGTGTLSGTPAIGGGTGTRSITFTANNGVAVKGTTNVTQLFTLDILPQNETAPVFTSANSATFAAGVENSFLVTTTGMPTPTLTVATNTPLRVLGLAFHDNGNGTATLSGKPLGAGTRSFVLTFTATGAGGKNFAAVQKFTLTIKPSKPPVFTSANHAAFTEGVLGSFTVTVTGLPIPKLTATHPPAGITFQDNHDGTGTLSGTPPIGGGTGTHSITFTANNGVAVKGTTNVTQVFSLDILPQNQTAPVFTSANSATFATGVQNSFLVTTTGVPTPALTVSPTRLPVGLTFHDNKDGTATLSGKPLLAPGNRPILLTFTATGAGGKNFAAVQKFTLTIKTAKPPMFTSANHAAFTEGVLGSFTITVTGLPIPKLTETGGLPAGVTFHDNHDGTATLSGVPATGTAHTYTIDLIANNGVVPPKGTVNVKQTFTLEVFPVP